MQSSQAQFEKLTTVLTELGFYRSQVDHSVFVIHSARGMIALVVYVDDIVITHLFRVKCFEYCVFFLAEAKRQERQEGEEAARRQAGEIYYWPLQESTGPQQVQVLHMQGKGPLEERLPEMLPETG